ncbi:MAG: 2-polyprenylphenol 6-hydroxylase, partial [Pseudomonadota bacterium]|nr:2-polyprenylphenol 6-hydroxylase [Pseudomonadota bacterium]
FTQALRSIGEPLVSKPLKDISVGQLLVHLFAVTEQFRMETQPQLLLLQKSMLMAEGIGRILNPRVNMWDMAREPIEDWMRANRGPAARARDHVKDLADSLSRLPCLVRETEKSLLLWQRQNRDLHCHGEPSKRQKRRWLVVAGICALVGSAGAAVVLTIVGLALPLVLS